MIVTFAISNNSCTKKMKRVLLVLALVSAVACSSAFAQLTIGGKLGFGYNGGNQTTKAGGVTTEGWQFGYDLHFLALRNLLPT